ncbi:MAG: dihydrofolate reductase [Paludibacter sp.]|jgi:dihydrofolate reductase|nr:dihydrofolate reductase [Paludibacter sp.]
MILSLIVAVANNNAIGYKNGLLCYLPADLQQFKRITTGHTIIMGRRTFESLPNGALPNRRNVVISSVLNPPADNSFVVKKSVEEALVFCADEAQVFVIGGESIYRQTIELADTLYITYIHADFAADTFFPEINLTKWEETKRVDYQIDEKNKYPYSFVEYKKRF